MSTLRRIGGPNAITAWTFGLTLVVFIVVSLVPSDRDQFIGTPSQRLALAALGTLAGCVVLAVAGLTVLRPRGRPSRPATAIAAFALAGAVQALAIVGLRSAMDLAPVDGLTLVVTRALAGVIWLAGIAIVVDISRSHIQRVAELRARIDATERAAAREQQDVLEQVEAMREGVLAPVRRALDEIVARLGRMAAGGRAEDEAEALRALVEDEVRPLSHELLGDVLPEGEQDGAAPALTRRERVATVARLSVTALAAPAWVAVLLPMALVLLFAIQEIGAAYLLAACGTYVIVVGILFAAARAALDPVLPRLRTGLAAACVIVVYEALAIVAVVNAWAWGDLSEIGRWVEWTGLITLPVIWLALATLRATRREGEAVEAGLEDVLGQLTLITARRRQRLRHERQVLGRLLHGSTQATLLSISARLAQAADDSDPGPSVEMAANDLRALRERLSGPIAEDWRAREALDDIAGMWSGVVRVDMHAPDGVLALLDAAPATRTAVLDVVAEGLTNAVRHGGAREVVIQLGLDGDDMIAVVVADDGHAVGPVTPGMGSEMLDEVTCGWSRSTGPAGSVLTAAVAVDSMVLSAPGA